MPRSFGALGPLALALSLAPSLASCTNRDMGRQDERAPAQPIEPAPISGASSSASASTSPSPEPSEPTLERHVAPLGFSLRSPPGWTPHEHEGEPDHAGFYALVSTRAGEGDRFVENVNVVVEALASATSLAGYADAVAEQLATLEGYRELEGAREVSLTGHPAIRREYEHRVAGQSVWVVSYALIVEQQAYVITASAAGDQGPDTRTELDALARSFELPAR